MSQVYHNRVLADRWVPFDGFALLDSELESYFRRWWGYLTFNLLCATALAK